MEKTEKGYEMRSLFLLGAATALSGCTAIVGEDAHVAKNRTIYNNISMHSARMQPTS